MSLLDSVIKAFPVQLLTKKEEKDLFSLSLSTLGFFISFLFPLSIFHLFPSSSFFFPSFECEKTQPTIDTNHTQILKKERKKERKEKEDAKRNNITQSTQGKQASKQ